MHDLNAPTDQPTNHLPFNHPTSQLNSATRPAACRARAAPQHAQPQCPRRPTNQPSAVHAPNQLHSALPHTPQRVARDLQRSVHILEALRDLFEYTDEKVGGSARVHACGCIF
eukprot:366011-Chlamydomonas_euryale.AAC.5